MMAEWGFVNSHCSTFPALGQSAEVAGKANVHAQFCGVCLLFEALPSHWVVWGSSGLWGWRWAGVFPVHQDDGCERTPPFSWEVVVFSEFSQPLDYCLLSQSSLSSALDLTCPNCKSLKLSVLGFLE